MTIYKDSLHKKLYAQDASMYQEEPIGVAFPASVEEIKQLVRQAQLESFSITTRSAGTSLAGQTTGNGVIMDISRHFTNIKSIDLENKSAVVEPGVIRDSLNRQASQFGLLFGPDTSTTNRCMIGGMIGNNSSGSFSIKYKTTREHVLKMDVVLSDGSEVTFEPLTEEELEDKFHYQNLEGDIYRSMIRLLQRNKELIQQNYPHPDIIRRNTGYALDRLCEMHPITPGGRPFNLCELLCGSEGTLAVTTSATLNLEPVPAKKVVMIPHFKDLNEAMRATVEAVKYKPAAVELVDDIILGATKDNLEHARNRFFLNGEPRYILIIQFEGNDEKLLEERMDKLKELLQEKSLGYSYPRVTAPESVERVWEVRKAGLGLLMGLGNEARTPAFCEDTAVRVKDLPEYVEEFEQILKKHETECVFYAHASVGELHFGPMIDTTVPEGVLKMKTMAKEIAGLVGKYRGSLSGEHGDGRARAPFIEYVLGKEMIPVLRQVKEIWDPNYVFNPYKIVDPVAMEESIRYSPSYKTLKADTAFYWRKERNFNEAIELCNGAGVCRKLAESGGTMCPSYMATTNEKDSTRGRANV
ncbi:MAG: FAD-binding oxidoreductase, partial [Balneolales bacterium]|nr:FAD-binding oxidoreductase [Balneolales bacterium]